MERRMLLAVVLSFLVIVLYGAATGQCSPPPPKPSETTPPAGTAPASPLPETPEAPASAPPGASPVQPPPGAPSPALAGDETPQDAAEAVERTALESTELEVGFSSRGGAVEFIRLRRAFESDKRTPLDLVVPEAADVLLGQIDLTALVPADGAPGGALRREDPAGSLRSALWRRDAAGEAATPEKDVLYRLETDSAVWTKRWILSEGEGRFDLRLRVGRVAKDARAAAPVAVKVLASAGLLREGSTGAGYPYPNAAVFRSSRMSSTTDVPGGLGVQAGADVNELRLLGARTQYFLASWYTEKDRPQAPQVLRYWATGEASDRRAAAEQSMADFFRAVRGRDPASDPALLDRIVRGAQELHHAWLVVSLPGTSTAADGAGVELSFFVGPIDRHVLRADEYAQIKPVISYQAAFDVIADALLGIYDVFRGLFGSAGLGVILMTLFVRGLMMPLSIKNQLSMRVYSRQIAKLKPKLDVLKKKWANNPKRLREEQTKLYREHGIGFPTGCLMMLVQIPIFFALFSCLRVEYTLRNSAFAWIWDLGAPDKLVDFGHTVLDLGLIAISSINILPLLMVGLSIWQQRLMPKPADEQQAQQMRMMKWLPIIFAVILYNYTAALSLYMVLSSVVSILESRVVRARDADAAEVAGADA